MEFRIAPMILIVLDCLYLIFCVMHLQDATIKQAGAGLGIVVLAFGASLSHSYYTKKFMNIFYTIAVVNVFLCVYIFYTCFQQNFF